MEANPSAELTLDLDRRSLTAGELSVDFALDDDTRWRLMNGLEDINPTLTDEGMITACEHRRPLLVAIHPSRPGSGTTTETGTL